MPEENGKKTEELLVKVVEEVHLLYHLEKEVAVMREDMSSLLALKGEMDEEKSQREKRRKRVRMVSKTAGVVILIAGIIMVALTFVSCDMLIPDFNQIFDSTGVEKVEYKGTSWISQSISAPYSTLSFNHDGSCTLSDWENIPSVGVLIGDSLVVDDTTYQIEIGDESLALSDGTSTYIYKLDTT